MRKSEFDPTISERTGWILLAVTLVGIELIDLGFKIWRAL